MSLVETLYSPKVAAARARITNDPRILRVLDPSRDPVVLERFLIQFSVSGYHMTEPVEGWIRRAGDRCKALGYEEIGAQLISHARHEAGHQSMMIDDAKLLVGRWNEHRRPILDVDALLKEPPLPATSRYVAIHENTIASQTPFGQVAIELEIEWMSPQLGPLLLARIEEALGDARGASFMAEHTALDVGHTAFNKRLLEKCLEARPESVEMLAKTGTEALNIYLDFLGECVEAAERATSGSLSRALEQAPS